MIKIYSPSDTLLVEKVDDKSYRQRTIMGQHNITIYVSKADALKIMLGSYIDYQGIRYTLDRPVNIKKNNTRNLEYTIIFESPQSRLSKYKIRNIVDKRLKFPYTAKPIEHLQLLVDNLNMRDEGWKLGECIDAVESVISYNHTFCSDALQAIAETFDTEWEIIDKTIHLRKIEYNKENPLALAYGKGNGFKTGITRTNVDSLKPIEILYTQGGERNIDYSKYGSNELLLPKNQAIGFDGTYFQDQKGFNPTIARYYKTDSEGYSISRSDKEPKTLEEDSLDCSNIYPSRVGNVTSFTVDSKGNYDFIDESIPENLDFSKYRIDGEKMTVIFQSGMLSGKEFDVMQTDNKVTGYNHNERRFMLVSQEYDGQSMPNKIFAPRPKSDEYEGDKYAVFGMMLPDEYICDNTSKSGASWEMLRKAVKYFYENEDPRFSFTGQLDSIWVKSNWLNISGKIVLGGYILFTDHQLIDEDETQDVLIRITGIKEYLNDPYSIELTLANVTAASYNSDFRKIEENEVVTETQQKDTVNYVKRTWKGMMELVSNIYDPSGSFQEDILSSVAIRSMTMALGDPLLQFVFLDNNLIHEIQPIILYNNQTKQIEASETYIKHNTLGFPTDTLQGKDSKDYLYWKIKPYKSTILSDMPTQFFYLYLSVSKSYSIDQNGVKLGIGEYFISKTKVEFDDDPDNYILWVAFINSEENNQRAITNMYGMAELTPDMLRINNIASIDGQSYIRLLANQFRIGDSKRAIEWNIVEGLLQILNATIEMKNTVGETVVKIDGETGSASFAKGNAIFDKDGNIDITGSLSSNNDDGVKVVLDPDSRALLLKSSTGDIIAALTIFSDSEDNATKKGGLLLGKETTLTTDRLSINKSGKASFNIDCIDTPNRPNGFNFNYNGKSRSKFEITVEKRINQQTEESAEKLILNIENILTDSDIIYSGDIYCDKNGYLKLKIN